VISRLSRPWNRFWFATIDARPLGAFRIAFGLLAIFNLLLLTVDFDYWLTSLGLLRGTEAYEVAGPWRPSLLTLVNDPTFARVVWGVTLAAAVGLTLGWRTRLMCIAFYVGMLSIHHRNVLTASGADSLLMCMAFYLMLGPCGAAYSLDARRAMKKRGGTPAAPVVVAWTQRLIQLQVTCVYLATSLLKVNGGTWLDGTAMHFVLTNREVGRFDFSFLVEYPVIVNVLTYGGLAIELSLAFFLWVKRARPWVILAGLTLHFGILLIINIPIFGELTTAGYLVFLSPGEWDWLCRRLDVRGWFAGLRTKLRDGRYRLPVANPLGAAAEVGLAD
jgi:hypothetical protein